MDLYDHIIYAAAATAITLACTRWHTLGRVFLLPILAIDTAVHIFVHFDLLRIVFALFALFSLVQDFYAHRRIKATLTPNVKFYCSILLIAVGAGAFIVLHQPYFLVSGLVIMLYAIKERPHNKKEYYETTNNDQR